MSTIASRVAASVQAVTGPRPGVAGVAAGGVIGFFAYLAVFLITRPGHALWINITSGLINAVSAAMLAGAVVALVRARIVGRGLLAQAGAHCAMAVAFCYAWYLAVIILNGMRGGSLSAGFEVNPFVSVALTWQLFQGFALYAVAAMGGYVLHYRDRLARLSAETGRRPGPAPAPGKVMVRGADGLISLSLDDILFVRAAGDGSVIVTRAGEHETRRTLTALADLFEEGRFLRVHRSILANRDAILSAEPAGDGRLTLHFPRGESVNTSRAGARLVREAAL